MIPVVDRIQERVLDQLRSDLAAAEPEFEESGLLLADGVALVGRRRWPVPLRHRFALEEGWLLDEMMRARGLGLRVGAFYHSHPTSWALRPSLQDRAGHPIGAKILIVGWVDGGFAWAGYRLAADPGDSGFDWEPWPLTRVPDGCRTSLRPASSE